MPLDDATRVTIRLWLGHSNLLRHDIKLVRSEHDPLKQNIPVPRPQRLRDEEKILLWRADVHGHAWNYCGVLWPGHVVAVNLRINGSIELKRIRPSRGGLLTLRAVLSYAQLRLMETLEFGTVNVITGLIPKPAKGARRCHVRYVGLCVDRLHSRRLLRSCFVLRFGLCRASDYEL